MISSGFRWHGVMSVLYMYYVKQGVTSFKDYSFYISGIKSLVVTCGEAYITLLDGCTCLWNGMPLISVEFDLGVKNNCSMAFNTQSRSSRAMYD